MSALAACVPAIRSQPFVYQKKKLQTDRIDHTSKLCTSFKGCAKLVVQTAVWQESSASAACVPFGIKQLEVRIKHEHRCQAKIIVMVNRWGSLGSLGFLLCDKQLWSLELEP
mmetsp:Transcript_92088/g.166285  ORF Transcript_92088/g.166285 Transcript_92088/m.166285 type:complete len:112 (+) Transcript_92088:231-566(+)